MAVSKVVYGNQTLIDLTGDTVSAGTLVAGTTAHDRSGTQITGTAVTSKYGVGLDMLFGEVDSSGILQIPANLGLTLKLAGFKDVVANCLLYKFQRSNALASVEFTDLETLANSSSLQNALSYCTRLTSVTFPKLKSIGNSSATSTNYRQLYSAFVGCTRLTELRFPELTAIYCNGTSSAYGSLGGNATITKMYFPKLSYIGKSSGYGNDTAANNVFYGCTALTEIHFSSANQTSIQASTGYSTKWGAPSSCQILFDL